MLDDDDWCPVLDGIPAGKERPMLSLLQKTVPEIGPRQLMSTEMCSRLRDDIYEFRKNPKGAKIRVLWFYAPSEGTESNPVSIICTHAFMKDTQEVPSAEIERAKGIRKDYIESLEAHEVYDLDDRRIR